MLCSGYNADLILSTVRPCHGKTTVIPNNTEHYTSFTINEVTFIDLCQFMLPSLDKLSSNLSKDQFRETRKYSESCYIEQRNHPQTNNVAEDGEGDDPCTSMKTIKTTLTIRQHSRQINNNKLKKT